MSEHPAKVSADTVLVEGGRGGDRRVWNLSALHPQGAAAAPDLLFQLVEHRRVPEAVHQPDQPGQLEIWHLLGTTIICYIQVSVQATAWLITFHLYGLTRSKRCSFSHLQFYT